MNDSVSIRDEGMIELINEIRACKQSCYNCRYIAPLRINDRTISDEELKAGKPLVDNWRGQKILFISQAPSKQAWADGVLNSQDNNFLSAFLLPKLNGLPFETWFSKIFWVHAANCYPYVNNHNRDNLPDMRCSNKWLGELIKRINPQYIILMGWSATKFFSASIRQQIESKETSYPSLSEILKWQYSKQSFLKVKPKDSDNIYSAIALSHASWPLSGEYEKNAYQKASEIIINL